MINEIFKILLLFSGLENWYIFYTHSTFLLVPATRQVWLLAVISRQHRPSHSTGNVAGQPHEKAPFWH